MTRKDYKVIAEAIKRARLSDAARDEVADIMARTLWDYDTTERFNTDKFLEACGCTVNA
jgi:hypothetical protein